MTLVKWLLGLFLTLVILVLAAVIIIPQFVDPNDYRDEISDLVRKQTGRDLAINGDLSLSVFPWLGVRTEQVTLSQPRHLSEAFGDGNMLEVGATEVKVKALPLLKSLTADVKDIQVATILLKQPKVHIITTKKGLSSFDGLTGDDGSASVVKGNVDKKSSTQTPSGGSADGAGSDAGSDAGAQAAAQAGIALVVQGVSLHDGNIIWEDRQAQQRYELKNLQLQTGNLLGKELADLSVSGELLDASTPDEASFSVDGQAKIDIDTLKVAAKTLKLSLARGDLEANASINSLDFVQDGLIKIGQLTANASTADEEVGPANIKLIIPNLDFDQSASDLVINKIVANGSYQKRPVNVEGTSFRFNLESQRLAMQQMNLVSEGLTAVLENLEGLSVIDKPRISGDLQVQPFNARELLDSFEIDYQPEEANALTKVALATSFKGDFSTDKQGNGGQVSLQRLKAQMDETELQGSFAVANLFGTPNIDFDLNMNALNVDSYAPKETGAAAAEQEAPAELDTSSLAVPLALFKEFKANGRIGIQSLIAGGASIQDIVVKVVSKGNTTEIIPSANLYSGKFGGSIKYQETADGAVLGVKQRIDAVQLLPLLKDADITDQLSGLGNVNVDLVVTEKNGVQSNKGTIKLSALNGAIKGVDIKKILDQAQLKYNELKGRDNEEGAGSSADETRFASMGGTFTMNDFVLDNLDFAMQAPLFRINGKGRIDIAKQDLDYGVDVSVVNSSEGQGGANLADLKGLTIPVKFYGDLTAPKYKIDFSSLLKAAAKDKLKKKLGIASEKKLSTKELLKQRLADKYINKSDGKTAEANNSAATDAASTTDNTAASAGDNGGEAAQEQTQQQPEQPLTKEEFKEQAKRDLKRKFLDSLLK